MPKFNKGETSKPVIDKKIAITDSIKRKAEIINKIMTYEDIPNSLEMKKNIITQTSVYKWNDSELGVISCSYNTAHAEHNSNLLAILIESIDDANVRLGKLETSSKQRSSKPSTRLSQNEVEALRIENEVLRTSLAEVYRAYMQLIEECREDNQIDAAYRKLILSQVQVLGRKRVWEVK